MAIKAKISAKKPTKAIVAKKLIPVRIDRAKWLTPDTTEGKAGTFYCDVTALKNSSKMCCLGFAAEQAYGIPSAKLVKVGLPRDLGEKWMDKRGVYSHVNQETWEIHHQGRPIKIPQYLRNPDLWDQTWLRDSKSERRRGIMVALSNINDSQTLTPKQREQQVAKGFEKLGWKAVFHGKYPKEKSRLSDRY
jgi:hypothetical protein